MRTQINEKMRIRVGYERFDCTDIEVSTLNRFAAVFALFDHGMNAIVA